MSSRSLYNGNVTPSHPRAAAAPHQGGRRPAPPRVPAPRLSLDSVTVAGSDKGSLSYADVEKGFPIVVEKPLPPKPNALPPMPPAIGEENERYAIEHGELHRQLKSRHIAMISFGGAIGTGLFIGTGSSLVIGGPLSLLLAYILMGSVCWSVMTSLGEMISHLPIQGGMITLAARFSDPALAIAMGWNYWYCWTTALPAELSAATVIMDWWTGSRVNNAVFIIMFLIVVVAINAGGARVYGETEFWFAGIKVVMIVALILFGVIVDLGGNPKKEVVGFRYWKNPGPFAQYKGIPGAKGQFAGFFAVVTQAAFSFIGTEISAIAAGEAQNPKRNLPRAVKRVWMRICLFYVGGVFVVGLLVPSNNPSLVNSSGSPSGSPFIVACQLVGEKVFPHIINACLLSSAWSAGSSDLYTASRALYGLAISGGAPRFLARTNSWGLPWICVAIGGFFGCLAFLSMGNNGNAGTAFSYLSETTSMAGLLTWWGIQLTYLRWWEGMKAQKGWGVNRNWMVYRAPWQPYTAWYGLIMITLILLTNGWTVFLHDNWNTGTFITSYLPLLMFGLIYGLYKWWSGSKWVLPSEMDFDTNSRDVIEEDEPPPKNTLERIWRVIV